MCLTPASVLAQENGATYKRFEAELVHLKENGGDKHKINQLTVNMERLRQLPDEAPERFIVVNIPSATLWAIDGGKVQFEMPVIVGRKSRPTSDFITEISGVRFNPTWTIPPTIMRKDILPNLRNNPNYLAGKGIELYDGYSTDALTLNPAFIDWNNITLSELYSFRMVQLAGKNNPLGDIRILMPNEHSIYLHDSNEKWLFSRGKRALSSGCIRMQDPEKVANFVLKKHAGWSDKSMRKIFSNQKTKEVYISEKIPVYLLYHTVWIDGDGEIIYGDDVYLRDKVSPQLLEKLD